MPDPFVAQLGRISGALLTDNLVRDGIDLTFRNQALDPDLLYLNVTDNRIGINTDSPAFAVDVNGDMNAIESIFNQAIVGNITFQSPSIISTTTGPVNITPSGIDPTIFFNKIGTTDISYAPSLLLSGNVIQSFSNKNIIFNPSGTGTVELQTNTTVYGNLSATGNISMDGNLSTTSNIIVGDTPLDIVVFETDFTQDIIPGADLLYDLGKSDKRWGAAYIDDWANASNLFVSSANINNQTLVNGVTRSITASVPNSDLIISPNTEITDIESLRFSNDTISNLSNSPIVFNSTGIGYYRFGGTTGVVIPSGTDEERPVTPPLGDTRWSTTRQYLECFDGTVYLSAIGPGENVTQSDMEDLGNVWTLILG